MPSSKDSIWLGPVSRGGAAEPGFPDVALFRTLRHRCLLFHGHNGAQKLATKSVSSYTRPAVRMQGVPRAAVYRAGPKGHPGRERSPLLSPVLAIIAHRAPGVILSVDETGGYVLNLGVRFC